MKIINTNGGELQGLWTGGVKTKVKNSYLTIPVLANYKISDRWKVSLGPYVSYMTEGNFSDMYMKVIYARLMKQASVSTSTVKVLQLMIFQTTYANFNGELN